jgi:hypothetical protein
VPTAAEASGTQSQIQAALDAGLESLSAEEVVQFQLYTKWVLEADGTVFWVASRETTTVKGSLHYSTDRRQDETETIGANSVILSSESEITQFNVVAPLSMWIGSWPIPDSPPLQVAFSARGNYYVEANVHHYSGYAVFPALKIQVVNSAADLPSGPIVSNSLPIWLSYDAFAPVYSSFLVPDNAAPPYVVAHIEESIALAAAPVVGPWPGVTVPDGGPAPFHQLAASILARDRVKLTLVGFSNSLAWQYRQYLEEASVNDQLFGLANTPIPNDKKRTQVEIAALAQEKEMLVLANYNQGAMDAVARRLLLSASATVTFIGGVPGYGQVSIQQAGGTANGIGRVGA